MPTSIFTGDTSRLDKSLDLLLESGANMVRVWGGGYYEDDRFYEFCDGDLEKMNGERLFAAALARRAHF